MASIHSRVSKGCNATLVVGKTEVAEGESITDHDLEFGERRFL